MTPGHKAVREKNASRTYPEGRLYSAVPIH